MKSENPLGLESAADLCARLDEETARIRDGREAVGAWRVDPSNNTLVHTPSKYYIDLDRIEGFRDTYNMIRHISEKSERWMPSKDLGDLVHAFSWLGLLPHA